MHLVPPSSPKAAPWALCVQKEEMVSSLGLFMYSIGLGEEGRAHPETILPWGPTSSLVPAELGPWARANRVASWQRQAPQGRRWLRTTAPRGARAPALSLATPTELQRSWKQQKMGWAAPMLSGSVASQELAQVLVTTGLSLKGNSGGRAGVRAQSPPRPHQPSLAIPVCALHLALSASSQDTLTDRWHGSHPGPCWGLQYGPEVGAGNPRPPPHLPPLSPAWSCRLFHSACSR